MILPFHHLYLIVGLSDSQPASFPASLAASVDGNQEVVAAAFHIQRYLPVVVYYDGAYVQTVGRNRSNGDCIAMRDNDRPADA